MNGQVHTGAGAEMEFPAELGSITGLHLLQIFFALLSFQIGSCCWSSRCFHCLLKAIAVCGQAVVFIYQLEAPARYSCISLCTPFCCAMKYHSDYFFFNKHHTYGKKCTWKILLFSFTQSNAVTFKREIRKLYRCVKTELGNRIRK